MKRHIVLLPGLLSPVNRLFLLVRYLRDNTHNFGVTAIPLGLSMSGFDKLVNHTLRVIERNLFSNVDVRELILFGHSHGGRVACAVLSQLKESYPHVKYSLITAGTPIVEKPRDLDWYRKMFYILLSRSYREWHSVIQPSMQDIKYYSFYSDGDEVVKPESIKMGNKGVLIKLENISHRDLISPRIMGDELKNVIYS